MAPVEATSKQSELSLLLLRELDYRGTARYTYMSTRLSLQRFVFHRLTDRERALRRGAAEAVQGAGYWGAVGLSTSRSTNRLSSDGVVWPATTS
jgi:hypothetical protein